MQGFTDAVHAQGRAPSTRIARVDRDLADDLLCSALKLKNGSEVWVIERIRLIDGEPAMLETAHLPVSRFQNLDRFDLSGSLYHLMESQYGFIPEVGEESISAANANRYVAKLLDIPIASALLSSVRTSRTAMQVPLEHTYRFVRPELCSFNVMLVGAAGLRVHSESSSGHPADSSTLN